MIKETIETIKDTFDIEYVIDLVKEAAGVDVYFDDSRAWSIYSTQKPVDETTPGEASKYGAWRAYLGGGVRGPINCNLTGDLGDLFVTALKQIEKIINDSVGDCEVWDQPTGVLLDHE